MRIVSRRGRAGCGQGLCMARLTCHLVYLRFTTRGLARGRRRGSSRPMSSPMAWRQSRPMVSGSSGGKSALPGDGPAGNAQRGDERHTVWVVSGVLGGVEHQRADRVVAAQVAPDLLAHQLG